MGAVLSLHGVSKRYGKVQALEDLTLEVLEGEVFGFLGPNGAGKTTTIRIVLGLISADRGGFSAPPRELIGYLPGELALWPERTGAETLDLLARLSGRPPLWRERLLGSLELDEGALRRRVRTYSDGMKQKLGLVQALQCAPRLAVLDEPTKGLDPLMQQSFYAVLEELRNDGVTVFFSSHILTEVERVSDRVGMIRSGRLVALGGVDEVRRAQRRRVRAAFAEPVDAASLCSFGEVISRDGTAVELLVSQAELPALIARLGMLPLADLEVEPPRLEDAFLEYYR